MASRINRLDHVLLLYRCRSSTLTTTTTTTVVSHTQASRVIATFMAAHIRVCGDVSAELRCNLHSPYQNDGESREFGKEAAR